MWLKLYAVFMSFLVFSTYLKVGFHGYMDYINTAETILELFGLVGYAFRLLSFNARFWKITFPFFIAYDLLDSLYQGGGWTSVASNIGFQVVFGLPMYLALFRYAYRSRDLWRDRDPA